MPDKAAQGTAGQDTAVAELARVVLHAVNSVQLFADWPGFGREHQVTQLRARVELDVSVTQLVYDAYRQGRTLPEDDAVRVMIKAVRHARHEAYSAADDLLDRQGVDDEAWGKGLDAIIAELVASWRSAIGDV